MLIIENVNRSFRWEYNYYFDLCQEILQKKFWTRSSPLMIKLPVRAFPHKFSNRLPLKMFSRKISSTDRSNNSDTNHNMETHRTFWVPYLLGRFSFVGISCFSVIYRLIWIKDIQISNEKATGNISWSNLKLDISWSNLCSNKIVKNKQ